MCETLLSQLLKLKLLLDFFVKLVKFCKGFCFKYKYIYLDEAVNEVYKTTRWADHMGEEWEGVGVSRGDYTKEQLLEIIRNNELDLYGVICLKGNKLNQLESVPKNKIPYNATGEYTFSKDLRSIYYKSDLQYDDVCIRRKDFKKALKKGSY